METDCTETFAGSEACRQTDRQSDGQPDGETDRQTVT